MVRLLGGIILKFQNGITKYVSMGLTFKPDLRLLLAAATVAQVRVSAVAEAAAAAQICVSAAGGVWSEFVTHLVDLSS